MATLSVEMRTKVWRGVMRKWSRDNVSISVLSKHDIYNPSTDSGAVADLDGWQDAYGGNTAPGTVGANGTLALVVRQNLPVAQKAELFAAIAGARYNEDLLRAILGDID